MPLFLATIFSMVCVNVAEDLASYASARNKWTSDKISNEEPIFDRKLFLARIGQGLCRGVTVAIGASGVSAVASSISSGGN